MDGEMYTVDEIREMVRPLLERYDMASTSLFGSYARGEATADSDIDVLLRKNEGARVMNAFGVAEELHCASGKDVDVYEISELDDGPFRDTVLADAIPLCGKAPFPGDGRVGKRGQGPASLTTPERAGNPAGPSGGTP